MIVFNMERTVKERRETSKDYPEYELLENELAFGVITWFGDERVTNKWLKTDETTPEIIQTTVSEFIDSLKPTVNE
jgi:hypothetical protein